MSVGYGRIYTWAVHADWLVMSCKFIRWASRLASRVLATMQLSSDTAPVRNTATARFDQIDQLMESMIRKWNLDPFD